MLFKSNKIHEFYYLKVSYCNSLMSVLSNLIV